MVFQGADQPFAVQALRALHGIGPLLDDGVGGGAGAAGVLLIVADIALNELLALGDVVLAGQVPGPGFGADHALHHQRPGLLHHALGQVGHDDLRTLLEAHVVHHAHAALQVLAEQHQHEDIRLAAGRFIERRQVLLTAHQTAG